MPSGKSQIPATAAEYKTELPATFKLPQGVAFQFDEASPELGALREWAHGQHFSQQQFSEMLSFHAAAKGREDAAFAAAVQRERDALGAAATVRVDAVAQWIKGTLGEGHQDKAQALLRGLELLASKQFPSAPFSQAHRTPEPAPRSPPRVGRGIQPHDQRGTVGVRAVIPTIAILS